MSVGGFNGAVSRSGNELIVAFAFTPRRYRAIRQIRGARYHPSSKTWRVPLNAISELEKSFELNPRKLRYEIDRESVSQEIVESDKLVLEARNVLKANPYAVSSDVINRAKPQVVFTFNKGSIIATPEDSKKKLFKHFHYVKSEKGYFIPTADLSKLISELKLQKVVFAVEESLGVKLKEGAELRSKLISNPSFRASENIIKASLFPSLVQVDRQVSLLGVPQDLYKLFLTRVRSQSSRREKLQSLNHDLILEVIYDSLKSNIKLWIASEVESLILKMSKPELEDGFQDYLVIHPEVTDVSAVLPNIGPVSFYSSQSGDGFTAGDTREIRNGILFPIRSKQLLLSEQKEESIRAQEAKRKEILALNDCPGLMKNKELESKLFPHQRVAVQWLLSSDCGLLGDDMGLGKTISVISAFTEWDRDKKFLLVVAPASLVQNWKREVNTWVPNHRFELLPSQKKDRLTYLKDLVRYGTDHISGLIVGLEELRLDYVFPLIREIAANRETVLCVDESQRVKNYQSKGFLALSIIAPECKKRWLLSGTPIPNSIADIWTQGKLLDDGERLGKSFLPWLKSVAELGNEWSALAVRRYIPEAVEKTIKIISPIILRRKKEDVVDLPPKIFHVRDLRLSGDQKARYDEVRRDLVLRVQSLSGDDFFRQITNILEQYLRCVQIASNPRLIDESFKGEPIKFLELDSLVDEIVREKGEKLVVWSNYRGNISELANRYKEFEAKGFSGETSPKERESVIKEFQSDGGCKILLAIPAAGGVGITLTKAQTAVYLDKTWNAEHWLQSVDRLHRIGQTGTVNIISLHASKVDSLISKNLNQKEDTLKKLMDGSFEERLRIREEFVTALVEE